MSSARSASLLGVGSPEASAAEHDGEDNRSTPRHVEMSCDRANHPTAGDKMTVAGVVAN
jgi:hypothetical protein